MAEESPLQEEREAFKKIHILGTGSVGKLVAHALIGTSVPPPVTLIFHRPTYVEEFKKAKNSISLTTRNQVDTRPGFDAELALPEWQSQGVGNRDEYAHKMSDEPIHNLIVSVKAAATVSALESVKHRLKPESTILFLQNGMGIIDEVNDKIFPEQQTRPNYMLGINSHGIFATGVASATHAGFGSIFLGVVPRVPFGELRDQNNGADQFWHPGAQHLLRSLTAAPVLGAVALAPTELLQAQLEKLAVNCIVNPLTVLMDCRNGQLLHNFSLTRVMRLLLAEISLVTKSLPELTGVPGVEDRFSPEQLEKFTINVATKTAKNISSMLQDARRGSETEIEYLNGYIVKRGEELGLKPLANFMLMHQVKGKQNMISHEVDDYAPFDYGTPDAGEDAG